MNRPVQIAPRDVRAAVGRKLRARRQERQLTIENMAAATGLSKGFLSRVERDLVSPSVSTLVMLCDVLNIPLGDLFIQPDVVHVPWDQAPPIHLGGHLISERLLSPRREARFQVLRSQSNPGDQATAGEDLYTVNADVEFVHVVAGSIRLMATLEHWDLAAGDSLTLEGREPHSWKVLDPSQGVDLIWVLVPAAWTGTAGAGL
ncbi:MAG: helix-turn-helix domain-containing protein [Bifidobacteriaceae bacterium]|jgi:transcriptional regulator with XRE-family HTH domain|nr:helix-turn-helix domain-containing protein [Bifidobacteriaceae bacterium]